MVFFPLGPAGGMRPCPAKNILIYELDILQCHPLVADGHELTRRSASGVCGLNNTETSMAKEVRHKEVKAVVFDCDGVMFDTVKANTAYYDHILRHFGKPDMTSEQFAYTHMHTVDQALAFLFEDAAQLAQAREFRKQMSYLPFLQFMEIEPGLKPLLRHLKTRYHTAVATNRSDTMNRVLRSHGLEDAFDLVVTALDVANPKPHPDQLNKILDHFALTPDQMVFIGDSELDAAAARAAGVAFVAYANPRLAADFHIEQLLQVEDILNGH
jgi:HAD superfamily hydrolase (TIGR01509 family)